MTAPSQPFNNVGMSVSGAPGAGAITVSAALTGYQSFAAAGAASGVWTVSYRCLDGSAWAYGQGATTPPP